MSCTSAKVISIFFLQTRPSGKDLADKFGSCPVPKKSYLLADTIQYFYYDFGKVIQVKSTKKKIFWNVALEK